MVVANGYSVTPAMVEGVRWVSEGLKALSLKEARERAADLRAHVARDIDPIDLRRKQRKDEKKLSHLLKDIAYDAYERPKGQPKGRWEGRSMV